MFIEKTVILQALVTARLCSLIKFRRKKMCEVITGTHLNLTFSCCLIHELLLLGLCVNDDSIQYTNICSCLKQDTLEKTEHTDSKLHQQTYFY